MKMVGWFENVKGFIFGRPCFYKSYSDISYMEAVMTALEPDTKYCYQLSNGDVKYKKVYICIHFVYFTDLKISL